MDHYLVRGEFWREFLAPSARKRVRVLNPAESTSLPATSQEPKRSVLFLTAPYAMQEFWDVSDLIDILRALMAACRHEGANLIIRVHPLEQIGTYEAAIQRLAAEGETGVPVAFSQGAGLDDLLGRSAVAVTFSSTAFLECLRQGVPIVSFGWHYFSYRRQIKDYGTFHFCDSLAELLRLVRLALKGELPEFSGSVGPFLANTSEPEMSGTLRQLLVSRSAAA